MAAKFHGLMSSRAQLTETRENHAMVRAIGVLTLGVGLGLFGAAGPAPGADLGGDCCQDLEARVANLEATTATKGNRKVTLTITGQLSETALWTNYSGALDPSSWQIGQNPNNPDLIDIQGEGKIGKGMSAGFVIELSPMFDPDHDGHNRIDTRQTYVYLKSSDLGSIRLGHQKMSADGIGDTTIVNLDDVAQVLDVSSLNWATGSTFGLGVDRRDAIRYDSPVFGGFQVSGSYAPDNAGPVWDIAADWSGKAAGIDMVAGIGYQDDKSGQHAAFGWTTGAPEVKTFMASGGLRHELTGLFIQGGFANAQDALVTADVYHLQGGISKNFFGIGDTSIYGEGAEVTINGAGATPKMYGAGVVQNIVSAASEVFAGWRRHTDGVSGDQQIDTVVGGLTVKF